MDEQAEVVLAASSSSQAQLELGDAVELTGSTALLASSEGFIDESDLISHDGEELQLVKLQLTNSNGKDGITWVNLVSQ